MKIVIINAYCYMNKGDAGIINAMVKELKSMFSDAEITVMSLYPEIDNGKYGDCNVVGPIFNNYKGKNKYLRAIRNLSLYYFYILTNRLRITRNKAVKSIKAADVVISCGGGFFQIRSFSDYLLSFLPHMIQMRTAIQFKKNLVFYAQTIGKFSKNKFVMVEVRRILEHSKLIMVRESISYKYLNEILETKKVNLYQTGDIAFLLNKIPPKRNIVPKDSKLHVGITVRDWDFPGLSNRNKLKTNYKKSIIDLINFLMNDKNVSVYFLPQVIGPGKKSDLIFSEKIYSHLENKNSVFLVKEDLTPQELKYVYSQLDILVGTRMHSNIFALSEKVPCVAISYDPKTDGIMSDLKLNNYLVNISTVNSMRLIELVRNALKNKNLLRAHLMKCIPEMENKSMKNNTLLYNLIATRLSK